MNKLLIIYLITWGVLIPWAGCEVIKLTLEIPAGKENCFSEILNEKASYKFEYRLLNSDEIRGDDSVVSVSATDEYERSKLFGSNERHASHSFKSKGNGQMIHFCASNRLESKAVKVYFQLSTGIDINDFERLPLDNENKSLSKALEILEQMIQTVSPLRSLVDRELLLIDHSSRFKSVVLSVACYAIGLTFLVGIAQVLLLKNQLINKKVI